MCNRKNMSVLNLPPVSLKTKNTGERIMVFDFLRRRYVALTPEEWVRQHFVHFLVDRKGYPAALLANEVSLCVGGAARRCDTVLYRREGGAPRLIVEYKAPHVAITEKVFTQISSYNSVLRADYLIVTNGMSHYCCRMDYARCSYVFLPDVPDFGELE